MGLFVNTNVASLTAQRHFGKATRDLNSTLEKLASGYKINRASDGAGQLLLSEQLRAQVRGYSVAESNIRQGANMLNVADGALMSIQDDLQTLREVALGAMNGTVTDYSAYSADATAITNNIEDMADNASFNGVNLLDGSSGAINIQVGPDAVPENTVDISGAFADNQLAALGITQTTIASAANAQTLLGQVDAALSTVAGNLATIGGLQNQLSNRLEFVQISKENFAASEAVVRNVDIASETARLTQLQILQQASALALAQANQAPSIALRLLGG